MTSSIPNVPLPAIPNFSRAKRDAELKANKPVEPKWDDRIEEQAPAQQTQLILRIGMFFDGTGNNAANSALGALCGAQSPIRPEDLDASCKPYMSDPDSSYGNDVTNVQKLSELYLSPNRPEGSGKYRTISRSIYIDGIGTIKGEQDSAVGAGAGRGETGVAARVAYAFEQTKIAIKLLLKQNTDCEIRSLTFDIFGFSRGAAAARHFANQLPPGPNGLLGEALRANSRGFSKSFIDKYNIDINTGFIGLFDTVHSVAGLLNLGNVSSAVAPGIALHLPSKYFKNVVQLAARDEFRQNFALSSVSPDHTEITVPGAHSDIGGSYFAVGEECVLVSPMQALTVREGVSVQSTSIYHDALLVKASLIAQGWAADSLEVVTPAPVLLDVDLQDRLAPKQQRVFAALQLKRKVRGELSRVYLRVMHALAKDSGVPFDEIPDVEGYIVPTELQPLCERFLGGDYTTTAAEESLLRDRYIHISAHWNNPLKRREPSGLKLVYVNAPSSDGKRIKHPHAPDWWL